MPNFINSSYGPGTSSTSAQGPTGMDVSPYLMALLQAEQRHLSQRTTAPRQPERFSAGGSRVSAMPSPATGGEGNRSGLLRQQLMQAQVSKAKSEAKALSSRIPTRMSTVGGQSFATPDHLAMTGAQRAVFLPNNAAMQGGIGELSAEDEDFLIRMRAARGAR
jgi:hypothetical protein